MSQHLNKFSSSPPHDPPCPYIACVCENVAPDDCPSIAIPSYGYGPTPSESIHDFPPLPDAPSTVDSLIADPLLEVCHLLGVSRGGRSCAHWLTDDRVVLASSTAILLLNIDPRTNEVRGEPLCLFGHSKPIEQIQVSADGVWLASVQGGGGGGSSSGVVEPPSVRVWHCGGNHAPKCHTILSCPSLLSVRGMAFDPFSKYIAIGGVDCQRRQQLFVWDISRVGRGGNASLFARQLSDWDLGALKFSPHEELRILSCGKENIRFWRVKDAHLPGQSVVLNALARNTHFTDLCFEVSKGSKSAFYGISNDLGFPL